MYLN
ncbi:aromatic amino acid permease domain protein, partial [Yersinia pestis PY-88]